MAFDFLIQLMYLFNELITLRKKQINEHYPRYQPGTAAVNP